MRDKRSASTSYRCTNRLLITRAQGCDRGFSLLELAIVLAVTSYMMKSFMTPFGAHYQQGIREATESRLELVLQSVLGFAAAHHRLPCPAGIETDGLERYSCPGSLAVGFVPATTLGLDGPVDSAGRLLDGWNVPIRYAIGSSDHPTRGTSGQPDFSVADEMAAVGTRYLASNLAICRKQVSGQCPLTQLRANQVPVLVVSTGKDQTLAGDQGENQDNDSQFVDKPWSTNAESPFDDTVMWISENMLFYELIRSGVLP